MYGWSFDEFINELNKVYNSRSSDERKGQRYFNALYALRPDLADQIRATLADPFYRDTKLPAFFERLEELYKGEA
jgi:hypothetical protein